MRPSCCYPGIAHLLRIVAQGLVDEFDASLTVAELPIVSIDTETTGKDPAVDRLIEFAAIVYERGEVVARHRWLVNPGCAIPKESFEVHGIDDSAVQDAPAFAAMNRLIASADGSITL